MDGLEIRRGYIYDAESPEQSPYAINVTESDAIPVEVSACTFGPNLLVSLGSNVYAEFTIDDLDNVRFDKWVDRGVTASDR